MRLPRGFLLLGIPSSLEYWSKAIEKGTGYNHTSDCMCVILLSTVSLCVRRLPDVGYKLNSSLHSMTAMKMRPNSTWHDSKRPPRIMQQVFYRIKEKE